MSTTYGAPDWINPYKKNPLIPEGLLGHEFDELTPDEFYRGIFGHDELDEDGSFTKGKYVGIAIEITKDKQKNGGRIKRHTILDDLNKIDELTYSNEFCLTSPISYAGRKRVSNNARFMYALCVEIDSLRQKKDNIYVGLNDLVHQCKIGILPKPTYIVASGNGVHLYYVFEKPIPLFKDVAKSISKYKRWLTRRLWNKYITTLHHEHEIQYESIFQAFRMPGTLTKRGIEIYNKTGVRDEDETVKAFIFDEGEKVSIEYMNSFIRDKSYANCKMKVVYQRKGLSLAEAKEAYPEWYQKRIVEGNKERDQWECNRGLYDWWKRRILKEGSVGHRYYCLMMLSIYAIKCGSNITYEELEQDCFEIMEYFDTLTSDPDNPFTERDVVSALQAYEDKGYATYPINSIVNRSGIHIEKNKRNFRKKADHIKLVNDMRKYKREVLGEDTYQNNGRPTKQQQVQAWRLNNPDGKKADCIRELGIDKKTVYKWWNETELDPNKYTDDEIFELELERVMRKKAEE